MRTILPLVLFLLLMAAIAIVCTTAGGARHRRRGPAARWWDKPMVFVASLLLAVGLACLVLALLLCVRQVAAFCILIFLVASM